MSEMPTQPDAAALPTCCQFSLLLPGQTIPNNLIHFGGELLSLRNGVFGASRPGLGELLCIVSVNRSEADILWENLVCTAVTARSGSVVDMIFHLFHCNTDY
jgi:hypothetical protein